AICLKSGGERGVEDVLVRDSHVLRSSVAQGLKLGTASSGHFSAVTFENIAIDHVDKAAMAVESVDGADIAGVNFDNISFDSAGAAFFVLLGKRGNASRIGKIERVTFSNIRGGQTVHTWGSSVSGTAIDGQIHAPTDLTFDHVQVTSRGGSNTPTEI